MKNINKLKKKIDLIDNKILSLLKSRSKLAIEIGGLKKINSEEMNLFRPERQAEILKRLFSKRNDLLKELDIFKFWRQVFLHQTSLQGKLEFLIPQTLRNTEKEIIHYSFGIDIHMNVFEDINKAFSVAKKKNNILIILPYPGKLIATSWWLKRSFKNLFIIAAVPFILKKKVLPRLVIISKNKPILKGEHSFIYKSSSEQNKYNLKKIAQLRNNYLYTSNILLNNKKLKILGAYPNLNSNENEKNK